MEEKELNILPKRINLEYINSTFKIEIRQDNKLKETGTGFFIEIEKIKFIMTNNHIITQKMVDSKKNFIMKIKNNTIEIKLDKYKRYIRCFEKPIDITIIEILEEDNIKNEEVKFLEFDLEYCNGYESNFNKDIYSFQYDFGRDIPDLGYGKILRINNHFEFEHNIDTDFGSSGSPIILNENNKVIGIHKGKKGNKKRTNVMSNQGTFLGIIKDKISCDIHKLRYAKNVKSIYNQECNNRILENVYENYDDNCYGNIYETELCKEFNRQLNFCFNDDNNISHNFNEDWNILKRNNVKNKRMISNCKSLKELPDNSEWNTNNIINTSEIFFSKSLKVLPDNSEWNTNNITNMNDMFSNCKSLKELPDISKRNTKKITNMRSRTKKKNYIFVKYIKIMEQ